MNPVVAVAVIGAVAAIVGAFVGAAATLSMNRANASKMLAEAQQIAQKTAFESWQGANSVLEGRCARCETELLKLQDATKGLIDANEAILDYLPVSARGPLRSAIWAARQAV